MNSYTFFYFLHTFLLIASMNLAAYPEYVHLIPLTIFLAVVSDFIAAEIHNNELQKIQDKRDEVKERMYNLYEKRIEELNKELMESYK